MRLLDRLFGRQKDTGKDIAAQRLKLVLAHDRANISPGLLAQLKDDIIEVISQHLEIEPEDVRVNFKEDQRETRLIADIPLKSQSPRAHQ
jgi:cell division topological specificity factor